MIWIGGGLVLLLIFLGISLYACSEITNIPFLAVPYTPKDFNLPFEEKTFTTFDGLALRSWFIPATPPSSKTVVVLHGQGSNAGDNLVNTLCLRHEVGVNLFYYDFRGHGASEGNKTSLGPYELRDFDSALEFLEKTYPDATKTIGVYGHSLGGAIAIMGTARHPQIKAVLVENPFASIRRTIAHFTRVFYGLPNFPFVAFSIWLTEKRLHISLNAFNPELEVPKILPRPICFFRSGRDRRIPLAETQRLWDAALEPKEQWLIPEADHGDAWMVRKKEYEERLVSFFKRSLS